MHLKIKIKMHHLKKSYTLSTCLNQQQKFVLIFFLDQEQNKDAHSLHTWTLL